MNSLLLLIIVAVLYAVMDVLSNHFPRSIFKNKNPKWWNPKKSWRNKYAVWSDTEKREKLFYAFSDAYHTTRSISLVLIILAVVVFDVGVLTKPLWFIIILGSYLAVYKILHNKILRVKNEVRKY
jgi:hypothetical protein